MSEHTRSCHSFVDISLYNVRRFVIHFAQLTYKVFDVRLSSDLCDDEMSLIHLFYRSFTCYDVPCRSCVGFWHDSTRTDTRLTTTRHSFVHVFDRLFVRSRLDATPRLDSTLTNAAQSRRALARASSTNNVASSSSIADNVL